jgi:hypothetical protein
MQPMSMTENATNFDVKVTYTEVVQLVKQKL